MAIQVCVWKYVGGADSNDDDNAGHRTRIRVDEWVCRQAITDMGVHPSLARSLTQILSSLTWGLYL